MTPSGGLLSAKVVIGEAADVEVPGGVDAYMVTLGAVDYPVENDCYVSVTVCDATWNSNC